jgi:hypothetical protein
MRFRSAGARPNAFADPQPIVVPHSCRFALGTPLHRVRAITEWKTAICVAT